MTCEISCLSRHLHSALSLKAALLPNQHSAQFVGMHSKLYYTCPVYNKGVKKVSVDTLQRCFSFHVCPTKAVVTPCHRCHRPHAALLLHYSVISIFFFFHLKSVYADLSCFFDTAFEQRGNQSLSVKSKPCSR